MPKQIIDPLMEARAIVALHRTWDVIAGDTLQSVADEKEKSIEQVLMPRSHVIDMVASCGFTTGYPKTYGRDDEAVEWLENLLPPQQEKILRKAFSHKRYGV
jgi:hypothetical protein